MKKATIFLLLIIFFVPGTESWLWAGEEEKNNFSLQEMEGMEKAALSQEAQRLLKENGFVVTAGYEKEMYDIYSQCKKRNQPIFVTTDSILHTSHIFFDYVLRILEIEKLYDLANELTERMIHLSQIQYQEAHDEEVKQIAKLNIGFFAVVKKIFEPNFQPSLGLSDLVKQEIDNIEAHKGLEFRALLAYIDHPSLFETPYAYEDYSQYIPRGHYTRNEKFKRYFKAMMWYGRIDFKLKPGKTPQAAVYGQKMTLQAILMADALKRDEAAYKLWAMLYKPTVYFIGSSDDLDANDYIELIEKIFPSEEPVDKYNDQAKLSEFVAEALKRRPPRILSGAAFVEEGEAAITTKGFRFMGQKFIPDSYIFQQLVFGRQGGKAILRYTGSGQPFTMEVLPNVGPARAFPRGLDVLAVLGSKRALEILEEEGDTEYEDYYQQLNKLKKEFSALKKQEWQQNLYWRWLDCLRSLIKEPKRESIPLFMKNKAWLDKELQTTLGSWTELRHDTILYAKQSYTMMVRGMIPEKPIFTFGFVEPYPEVYQKIKEMMTVLREIIKELSLSVPIVGEKIKKFESLSERLASISEKELRGEALSQEEYELIWNIGRVLASLKSFPSHIMEKITSGTDERIDLVADVHTDLNTKQVLEESVGSPFNLYVIIKDRKGYRLCQGAAFSYYEFKHPLDDRLTDEKWQEMGKKNRRPAQPAWTKSFIAVY